MEHCITPREVLAQAFPGIAGEQADEIIVSGQVRHYPEGAVLCHEGAREVVFYIILSGEVEITKKVSTNEVRALKRLGPGEFFGEIAILHDAPRAATVTTTAPTSVLEIRKEAFTGIF